MAEQEGVGAGGEVAALDQHVGGHRDLHALCRAQQRAVVADAEFHAGRRGAARARAMRLAVEVPPDQAELGEHAG